jgi:hypothetical protein
MPKSEEFYDQLRNAGLRKKVAKPLAALDDKTARGGAKDAKLARQAVHDLTSAAEAIDRRILGPDRTRSQAARKAAATRKRNAAKRSARARRGAKTRASARNPRVRAKKARSRR